MPDNKGREQSMRVTVEIPDRIGWALTDRAEARGINLGGLIGRMVVRAWTPTPGGSAPTMRDRVEREWSKGAPDAVIAHRLGEPVESVRVARRSLNLSPHKFRREQWAHELTPSQPPASSGVSFTQEEAA
jgi:hypothetical protein